jgi:hypothetical protein
MKIIFDTVELSERLSSFTDEYLCSCWHIAQANDADISEPEAGEFAEAVGREIIRRFVQNQGPTLWNHQGRHALFCKSIAPIDPIDLGPIL